MNIETRYMLTGKESWQLRWLCVDKNSEFLRFNEFNNYWVMWDFINKLENENTHNKEHGIDFKNKNYSWVSIKRNYIFENEEDEKKRFPNGFK